MTVRDFNIAPGCVMVGGPTMLRGTKGFLLEGVGQNPTDFGVFVMCYPAPLGSAPGYLLWSAPEYTGEAFFLTMDNGDIHVGWLGKNKSVRWDDAPIDRALATPSPSLDAAADEIANTLQKTIGAMEKRYQAELKALRDEVRQLHKQQERRLDRLIAGAG